MAANEIQIKVQTEFRPVAQKRSYTCGRCKEMVVGGGHELFIKIQAMPMESAGVIVCDRCATALTILHRR